MLAPLEQAKRPLVLGVASHCLEAPLAAPAFTGAIEAPPPLLLFQLQGDGFLLHQLITDLRVLVIELYEKSMQPLYLYRGELDSPKFPSNQKGKAMTA